MLKGSRTSLTDGEGAIERPRKKLSFREPEVMGAVGREADRKRESEESGRRDRRRDEDQTRWKNDKDKRRESPQGSGSSETARRKISVVDRGDLETRRFDKSEGDAVVRKVSVERREDVPESDKRRLERGLTSDRDWLHRRISEEDEEELESQAMKIVRTVGQAFEVCHKLSDNSPTVQDDDQDDHDPLQDLEASSDAFSDPRKWDGISDAIPDGSDLQLDSPTPTRGRHLHLEMIPPPPTSAKLSNAPPGIGETISSPLLEPLKDCADVPSAGTPLSAHHEIQLLREQLEQQCQQTQAAVAQVHLLRDQLTAETAARIEAQARTHQLLVHNKELLDHITSLVSHLQGHERTGKPDSNVTVIPQVYQESHGFIDPVDTDFYLDNRNSGAFVTAPSSPKTRHTSFFQQPQHMGSLYSLTYPTAEQQFQAQLLQRLQSVATPYPPMLSPPVYPSLSPYNFCTFPSPYFTKRRDDEMTQRRMDELRLDPTPAQRRETPKLTKTESVDVRTREGRERSRDDRVETIGRDQREKSREGRERSRDVEVARYDSRDQHERSRSRDDCVDSRFDGRDQRDKSREGRDYRERSRDDVVESIARPEGRDQREKSREGRDRSRDYRERSRDGERSSELSPNSSSPLNIPTPRSPKSPSPVASPSQVSPVVSPTKSSYTNAFASALSTIRTLRVTGGSSGDRGGKNQTSGPGPITRSTSEKVQNRSELMNLVQRTAWARQTK